MSVRKGAHLGVALFAGLMKRSSAVTVLQVDLNALDLKKRGDYFDESTVRSALKWSCA